MTAAPENPNKALWEKGDFTRIAATMRDSGEDFAAAQGEADDLHTELRDVFRTQNSAPSGDRTEVEAAYLKVTVRK